MCVVSGPLFLLVCGLIAGAARAITKGFGCFRRGGSTDNHDQRLPAPAGVGGGGGGGEETDYNKQQNVVGGDAFRQLPVKKNKEFILTRESRGGDSHGVVTKTAVVAATRHSHSGGGGGGGEVTRGRQRHRDCNCCGPEQRTRGKDDEREGLTPLQRKVLYVYVHE